jgi:AhpD family alkylhydroperoxidase
MEARIPNPLMAVEGVLPALTTFGRAAENAGVPKTTLTMLELRVSQINGCSLCVEMHAVELQKAGEPLEKIFGVGAWRESPHFDDAERAALALAEAITRIADSADPVPDDVWARAAEHYDEQGLAALVVASTAINAFNRINVATRQPAGWHG